MADQNKKITSDIVKSEPANDSAISKQNSGKGIILLLIIVLSALGSSAAYFLWQQQQHLETSLQNYHSALSSQLQQVTTESQTQINNLIEQHQQLESQLKETIELSQQAIIVTNRNQRDWVLAEIDYLLRIANRRLQISRDINGSIAALTSASQRLFDLGDLSFFEIRKQINNDVSQLKALHQVDINGTALKLDQIIQILDSLPFKTVQEEVKTQLDTTTDLSQQTQPEGFIDSLKNTLMNIGDIKVHQRSIHPASSGKQQQQIEQLLGTYLISSRLAVLRYDSKQFNHDIEQSLQLIHLHYKASDNRVIQVTNDLLELQNINLTPDLPDITRSWKMLHDLSGKQPADTSSTKSSSVSGVEVL